MENIVKHYKFCSNLSNMISGIYFRQNCLNLLFSDKIESG